ncbi:MAG: disulfide bond formation protein B [Loktanella sp.]|nr:disulfide bond formation protein B [Loktanella sp.]
MTRNLMVFLAGAGSFTLLAGAYLFQALGYPPCAMCLWQRWPHMVAILIAVLALRFGGRALPALGAVAAGTTGALGIFHTGVERGFWQGPTSCAGGGGMQGMSGADLLSLDGPRIVMCDQVTWEFLTLSMASWNAIASFALMAIWISAVMIKAGSSRTV